MTLCGKGFGRVVLIVASAVVLSVSCTGKTEDVRINLCREVTERLLDSMMPLTWKSQTTEIRRAGDAAIRLGFSVNKAGYENTLVTSACFFEHDLPEESALDHVNPLAAYSTVPYEMTIEGKQVPKEVLSRALTDEQLAPFREFFDSVKQEIEKLRARQG